MEGKRWNIRHFLDEAGLEDEAVPRAPLLELLGDGRILIENHRGVTQYCSEKIQAQVNFGAICITGCNLRLRLMTGQKLIIVGRIDGIEIVRGAKK